jgi:hypothetical protein
VRVGSALHGTVPRIGHRPRHARPGPDAHARALHVSPSPPRLRRFAPTRLPIDRFRTRGASGSRVVTSRPAVRCEPMRPHATLPSAGASAAAWPVPMRGNGVGAAAAGGDELSSGQSGPHDRSIRRQVSQRPDFPLGQPPLPALVAGGVTVEASTSPTAAPEAQARWKRVGCHPRRVLIVRAEFSRTTGTGWGAHPVSSEERRCRQLRQLGRRQQRRQKTPS